jgi:hypothetical protein
MALLTVTNASTQILNRPDVGGGGVSPDAVGGNVLAPLPYPFDRNGPLAVAGSRQLAVHARDFSVRPQPQQPMIPADEWALMVQSGLVTLAFVADAVSTDAEDALIAAL